MIANQTQDALLKAATTVMERAYAPYSKFKVGVGILAEDGSIYAGCNIENASFPVGVCAETMAIGDMIGQGAHTIKAVLVINDKNMPAAPCGACRQRIREFAAGDDIPVFLATRAGIQQTHSLQELLPHSFGPNNLSAEEF